MSSVDEVGDLIETGRSGCRISLEWSIPDFLSLDTKSGKCYETPLFIFYNARWYLKIFPKKSYEGRIGFVSLSLIRYELDLLTTTFHATLGIRGADGVENRKEGLLKLKFGEYEEDAFCWDGFYARSKLAQWKSRLMPENKLIISLDLKSGKERDTSTQTEESQVDKVATEEKQSFEKQDTPTQTDESRVGEVATEEKQSLEKQGEEEVLKCLHKLLAGSKHSDVIIKIQGKEFHAHRAILQARSPVLEAMFNHDMVEKQSKIVTIEDSDPESFPAFLEHVYTGSIEIISVGNVFSLFTTADYFDMSILKEACTKFIKNNLTMSCFCDAITLAIKYNAKELIECVTEFFGCNISEILKTVEWQIFLKENTIVGNELIIKGVGKLKEELSLLKNN